MTRAIDDAPKIKLAMPPDLFDHLRGFANELGLPLEHTPARGGYTNVDHDDALAVADRRSFFEEPCQESCPLCRELALATGVVRLVKRQPLTKPPPAVDDVFPGEAHRGAGMRLR